VASLCIEHEVFGHHDGVAEVECCAVRRTEDTVEDTFNLLRGYDSRTISQSGQFTPPETNATTARPNLSSHPARAVIPHVDVRPRSSQPLRDRQLVPWWPHTVVSACDAVADIAKFRRRMEVSLFLTSDNCSDKRATFLESTRIFGILY
jgi:hypothetical protein